MPELSRFLGIVIYMYFNEHNPPHFHAEYNDTSLIGKVENGRLILEKRESVRHRLKARFADIPAGVSLADELIADRRREASQDTSL